MHWRLSVLSVAAVVAHVAHSGNTAAKSSAIEQDSDEPSPYVLKADDRGRPFGFLYTPEVLAALAARHPDQALSVRITEAIHQRTTIVVMWSLPATSESPAPPRPYKMAVLERAGDNPATAHKVDPLWIQQDATELAVLDARLRRQKVGAMAAFPGDAFAPGRWVYIYSGPHRLDTGAQRIQQRWATVWAQK
jgi:hypothetical protein